MKQPTIGVIQAIDLINGSFDLAERRLAERMHPARLAPLNLSAQNGRAASDAVIYGIRNSNPLNPQAASA